MDDRETFAHIRIDEPAASPTISHQAAVTADDPPHDFWQRPSGPSIEYPDTRRAIEPEGGAGYRMVPMRELLDILKINMPADGYIDDWASALLRSRLRGIGLDIATTITGPLKLRTSDIVPVVDLGQPQASSHTALTMCIYIMAWMLQADGATQRDLSIADAWIADYDPKERWATAAQGTLRWLLSRRLFMTSKRKQRIKRLKRLRNVRLKLLDVLLRLVSDPEYASPKRMKRLETIYAAIDLNPSDIHSDIHRIATASTLASAAETTTKGGIPALDTSRLNEMAKSTVQAQKILAEVFGTDDVEHPEPQPQAQPQPTNLAEVILRQLAQRDEWSRQDAQAIAQEHRMTLGAMLELINDLSYDLAGDAVADDGGDTIYIDRDTAGECLDKTA